MSRIHNETCDLMQRSACNNKKNCTAISESTTNKYMQYLSKELEEMPPSKVIHYDEKKLTDDPGNK